MDETINKWLRSWGDGSGEGQGTGWGDGSGEGKGTGPGNGRAEFLAPFIFAGTGIGAGVGSGNGIDDSSGSYGGGCGYGCGDGDGNGNGNGWGSGFGIKSVNGYMVHRIDDTPTIIYTVHGDVARGATVRGTLLKLCYIYRCNGCFAHGETIREAYEDAREKWINSQPLEDRIASFLEAYPTLDTEAHNADLYKWHHVLTGSCRLGRSEFCKTHNIDLTGKTKVKDFINLVKNSYGGKIIIELQKAYLKNQCSNK